MRPDAVLVIEMPTANQFRRMALSLTGAVEGAHMGHPDFRTNGRIFATLHPDLRHGMVALTPEQQSQFIHDAPEAFSPEAGAWGRQGCTRVEIARVDEELLGEALTLAWQSAMNKPAPRARRKSPARKRR